MPYQKNTLFQLSLHAGKLNKNINLNLSELYLNSYQDAEEKSKLTQYMVLQMKQKEPPLPIENLPFPFGPLLDECWAVDVDKRPSMTGTYWIAILRD